MIELRNEKGVFDDRILHVFCGDKGTIILYIEIEAAIEDAP